MSHCESCIARRSNGVAPAAATRGLQTAVTCVTSQCDILQSIEKLPEHVADFVHSDARNVQRKGSERSLIFDRAALL